MSECKFSALLKFLLLASCAVGIWSDEEDGPYKGKYLGKLNSYHHQVSGDVYAVDAYTLLIIQFSYDGNGADTFFWAGASNRPGPQGFIVPDDFGNTNILERYLNKDITITLPEKKKITDIKWFAVYDLSSQEKLDYVTCVQVEETIASSSHNAGSTQDIQKSVHCCTGKGMWCNHAKAQVCLMRNKAGITVRRSMNTFGDVYIPEEFEPPALQTISQFRSNSRGVKSDSIEVLDSKTLRIPQFSYDGTAQGAYLWVGVGPQPSSKGHKIPDEYGYLDPLRRYDSQDIVVQLPGDLTIFDIDWMAVFDPSANENCGWVIVPDGLNVPPSLIKIVPHKSALPNCQQLHKDFQVSWEIFGPQITIQLAGQVAEKDYMAFGISGSTEKSQMLFADVTIAYIDAYRGIAADYNISAFSPCTKVLGQYKGVCKDEKVGGIDSNQLSTFSRENGINIVTYRRTLISADNGDKTYPLDGPVFVVWALGQLDRNNEPSFHDRYPKADLKLDLNRKEAASNCFSFTRSEEMYREPWEKSEIFDRNIRTFTATIGPSGGKRGYQALTGMTTTGLAWYINGNLIPELWLRRGLTYAFVVRGGNNPHSAETYHPLIITTEPHGGLEQLSESAQKQIRVLAGVEYTRRGQPRPTAAGALCIAKHDGRDRRLDDDFPNFKRFNRSLIHSCEKGDAAILEVTPNSSWPDTVYYNSFTHGNMGWKIHVLDNYNARSGSHRSKFSAVVAVAAFFCAFHR